MNSVTRIQSEVPNISEGDRDVLKMAEKVLRRNGLAATDFHFALSICKSIHSSSTTGSTQLPNESFASLPTPPGNSPGFVVPPWSSFDYPSTHAMDVSQSPNNLTWASDRQFTTYRDSSNIEEHDQTGEGFNDQNLVMQNPYLTPGAIPAAIPHAGNPPITGQTLPSYPPHDSTFTDSFLEGDMSGPHQSLVETTEHVLQMQAGGIHGGLASGIGIGNYGSAPVPMHVMVPPDEPSYVPRPIRPHFTSREKPTEQTTKITKFSKPGAKKRGRFKDVSRKEETAETRRDNACSLCWKQKSRCEPIDPKNPDAGCRRCQRVKPNLPCVRWKIPQAELLDKGPHPRTTWTLRFKSNSRVEEINTWRPTEPLTINITQDVDGSFYQVTVNQFVAQEGDQLFRKWTVNGVKDRYYCPPFAITNMQATVSTISNFVKKNMEKYIIHYIQPIKNHLPGFSNRLLEITYVTAYHCYRSNTSPLTQKERTLLGDALQLWVACRMENRRERITDLEILGITPHTFVDGTSNNDYSYISPVMAAQIEIITMVAILNPKKKAVLKGLNDLILANKKESWFTIYLTMFILLHSCGLLIQADRERGLREPRPGSEARYFNPSIVGELHKGANNLLYYFHYFNQGSDAFASSDDLPRSQHFTNLNKDQLQFMHETAKEVTLMKRYFESIKVNEEYENQFYFVAQLYDSAWKPHGPSLSL